MSQQEIPRRKTASHVIKEAHRLFKNSERWFYNFAYRLKLAWKIISHLCKYSLGK